ncbi:MAG: BrnA antitoxin family protein [Bdellovibrionota bacterium]
MSDFLPPPNQLLPKEELIKITIAVDADTIEVFKEMAEEYGTKYQRMMREVLKGYAKKYGT